MSTLNSTLPANEARSNFYRMLDEVGKLRQFTITHRGKTSAVIMSMEEFESWQETLDILSNKKLVNSINKARKTAKTCSKKQADKLIGW